MTQTFADVREDFVSYVRSQLVGPFDGDNEVIADTPNRRYLMGILFPGRVAAEEFIEEEGEQSEQPDNRAGGDENLFSDTSVTTANDFLPASQGFTFYTSARSLHVEVQAARYETLEGAAAEAAIAALHEPLAEPTEQQDRDPRRQRTRRVWRRHPLAAEQVELTGPRPPIEVLEGRARLHVRWRPVADGALVTVTLVNAEVAEGDVKVDRLWDKMLLQTQITVTVADDGAILEYPSLAAASHDEEEEELRLQHRDARTHAIGHGCAVRWSGSGTVDRLWSDVMPDLEVPRVSADARTTDPDATRAMDIAWLSDQQVSVELLHRSLSAFIGQYRSWAQGQREVVGRLAHRRQRDAAGRILARIDTAVVRMTRGAELLANDATVLQAFRLANEAMLRQMRHGRSDLAGSRRRRAEAVAMPGSYEPGPRWRPFQLGFALLTLTGLAGDDPDGERDIVDLIWFPTGGGKTEAYLLLAAFEIFHRRIRHGDRGAGTTILSRYTLTLLTTQQFQRAATTICACERLRQEDPALLGDMPISIGLWVGDEMTPNHYAKAHDAAEALKEANEPDNRFVLERCPWCGTETVPRQRSEDASDYGITSSETSFRFHCTNDRCPFHIRLPVHVVDDDLYEHPPTFVLGTVDKFAGLAWEPRAGNLFGRPARRLPPTLVIQDELHLLTGPLGTTVGLYETAIQLLCEHEGRRPKVISSTATIRRAPDQVLGLFGRKVDLFPPSGISADDSYFAQADTQQPGRKFVGIMAQGHTSDTATVHTLAALLQAPLDLQLKGDSRDVYWTPIAYHSSLRELGRTVTMARDDVPSRLTALVRDRPVRKFEVDEITSNVDRARQPELLERLNLSCDERGHLDLVASTNMLSVGVDVPRLGLMLVNGQPKATAEYIQATSRVGRDRHPGLVFGLFRSTRPRDRSHYENFVPYHAALYRYVEPTSVTPWSPPSRDRAVHATLVILVRHHLGLVSDGSAGDVVNHLQAVDGYIEQIVSVTQAVEPREASRTRAQLQGLRDDWVRRANGAARDNRQMYYTPNGKGQTNLLKDFGGSGDGWPTLRSMRNVDRECALDVAKAGSASGSPRKA
ncbi:helicase-related protein [Actinoplanes sp. KI2]|uniref:helicase-related protein n=1 Tax=Actinoplanes sp. KI2 TaxID=2983315 RepID=UPI0021D5F5EF|nr:helicase-related protein [Actinoplanes sp. KI2]MCU7730918.1 helicase-related protein [Actinoplanes sp. KI2]